MSQVKVRWMEKQQFVGVDSTKHSLVISAQDEANATGVKPSDLLLLGLGGCAAVDVVSILEKKRQRVTGFEIQIQGEQEVDPPWTFKRIHLEYLVEGPNLTPLAVEQAVALSEEKYCSVRASLSPAIEITRDIRILSGSS
jgi:putative redox protein